jgi:hypothetical protein
VLFRAAISRGANEAYETTNLGSEVRILPGAPVYETSHVNRTAFTRPPYPGNREHARPISMRSDYESGGLEFESLRAISPINI